jgi:1-acyl-sn-glycerol-3-phosphate acyltransferase
VRSLLKRTVTKALEVAGRTPEEIAYEHLPAFLMEVLTKYLRVECFGMENIPKRGPCILIANHSGYMGFDAMVLGWEVYRSVGRLPRIIAHKLWFLHPEISVAAHRFGLVPATFDNGLKVLKRKQLLLLFPEGEEGNFKPSRLRYRLRRFRRGFVRLALETGAPIVPIAVIGAEETHLTLSQIRWAKPLLGIIIPVPLNVVPLPAKWSIYVGKPIKLKKNPAKAGDMAYVTELSRKIRHQLQHDIHTKLKSRKSVFLGI